MKVHVLTLGCPKNIVDSENLMGGLSNTGISFVNSFLEADVIIINTCAFILNAREEAIETILQAIRLKLSGKCRYVYVVGCLPQKYQQQLQKELPEVDGFYDQYDFQNIAQKLAIKLGFVPDETVTRLLSTPAHYAYLKIAEGCSNRCSYCTIPLIKGKYSSKNISQIFAEAKTLVKQGVRELIIIAQDTTYYGRDLNDSVSLPVLLTNLSLINRLKWLRLLYAYSAHITDDLIYLFKDNDKICKYIDIPLQHISDHILKKMGRKVTAYQIRQLIDKLRSHISDIAIRTTLMVGFPGETKRDFNELLQFVRDTKFERLGVLKYSQEKDTPASLLANQVNEEEKEERLQEIVELQRAISLERNREMLDKEVEVVIDKFDKEENCFIARTQWDSPSIDNRILINDEVAIGSFTTVKIKKAREYDLEGVVVK